MAGWEGRRKLTPRQSSFSNVALMLLLPVGGLLIYMAWTFVRASIPPPAKVAGRRPRLTKQAAVIPKPAEQSASAVLHKHKGDIVLILDDVGWDHQQLSAAMALDTNVNFSVLPNAPNGTQFARQLHASGFEVLCHLPMEPEGFPSVSPGTGAVLTSMSDVEIAQATSTNVALVPFARGVNNHMGSRATKDRRVMRGVLESLPPGMYFIDSRTTGRSVGFELAREMKVPTAARHVFLDDVQTAAAVREQLAQLRRAAEERGTAIAIGHMYPVTIHTLAAVLPELRRDGFRLIRASQAVR